MGVRLFIREIVFRDGLDFNPLLRQCPTHLLIGKLRIQSNPKMKSGLVLDNPAVLPNRAFLDGFNQSLPLPAVVQPHPVDVLLKVSVSDKRRQRILLKGRYRTSVEGQLAVESVGQMHRKNHVADSNGWRQGLGKGIHIDHPFAGIDAEQRGQRFSVGPEFAVVVVFDDVSPRFFIGPGQHLVSPAGRHGDTTGKMMIRTDMDDIRSRLVQLRYPNAMLIHGNVLAVNAVLPVYVRQNFISRVLDAVLSVAANQLYQQAVQVLRSGTDDNLIRIHQHPPKGTEIIRDGRTQCPDSPGRRNLHQFFFLGRDGLSGHSGPYRKRKCVGIHRVAGQVHVVGLPVFGNLDIIGNPAFPGNAVHLQDIGDVIAFLRDGVNVTLADQLVICILNRYGTNPVVTGKRTFRREFLPGTQSSGHNVLLYVVVHLLVQRFSVMLKDVGQHRSSPIWNEKYKCFDYLFITSLIVLL